jgi:hypothetical protein
MDELNMKPAAPAPMKPELPPHHVSGSMKVLMLILALVVIAALGYLVWFQNSMPTGEEDNSVNPVKTTNGSTTTVGSGTTGSTSTASGTSATANWKTYTNSTLGYTVQYPTDWSTKDFTSIMSGYTNYIGLRPTSLPNDTLALIYSYTTDTTVANAVARLKQDLSANSTFIGQTQETLNGLSWTKLSFRNNSHPTVLPTYYIYLKGTKVVVMSGPGSTGSAANDEIVTLINKSLAFTN